MKFFKSKFFLISLSAVLLLALITGILATLGFTGPIKLVLGTAAKPFLWVGTLAADAVNGFVEVFTDYDRLKAENDALRAELESIKENNYNSDVLAAENQWLKDYINFADSNPGFKITDGRIIGRQTDNYSTVLTLDRGSIHGIKTGMPVITAEGTFGQITEAGLDWCHVESIVEAENSVGVYSLRSGATGVVTGDADLRDGGVCRMSYVDSGADLRIGDKIYTSGGVGSSYPSGLYIGEISAINYDESTRQLTATVTPAVDFTAAEKIERMMIVTGYGSK